MQPRHNPEAFLAATDDTPDLPSAADDPRYDLERSDDEAAFAQQYCWIYED